MTRKLRRRLFSANGYFRYDFCSLAARKISTETNGPDAARPVEKKGILFKENAKSPVREHEENNRSRDSLVVFGAEDAP